MVDTPSMLNAKLLLSGVKRTSKVVAPIPLFSIHVAKDLEPICRMPSTDCRNNREAMERMRNMEETEERVTRRVRLGKEKRIAPRLFSGCVCCWLRNVPRRSGSRFKANER